MKKLIRRVTTQPTLYDDGAYFFVTEFPGGAPEHHLRHGDDEAEIR